jgi:hypothetical protein
MGSLKFVKEIIALTNGSLSVIPARLGCLAREESRIPRPFARQIQHPHPAFSRKEAGEGQIRARVTNAECITPNYLRRALQTQDTTICSKYR